MRHLPRPSNSVCSDKPTATDNDATRTLHILIAVVLAVAGIPRTVDAQRGLYKARISAHWFADNTHFWYRNDLPEGKREFILVSATDGVRKRAFDHERLAKALLDAGVKNAQADRLPLENIEFDVAKNSTAFRAGGKDWLCNLATYELSQVDDRRRPRNGDQATIRLEDAPRRSARTGPETELTFVNRMSGTVELFWLDQSGRRRSDGKLAAGAERQQHTFAGHVWHVVDDAGRLVAVFQGAEQAADAVITGRQISREPARQRPQPRRSRIGRDTSPDGKWRAFVRDGNVFVRATDGEEEIQLSTDGEPQNSYQSPQWSGDSNSLVAFRVEPGEQKEVHLIESSPRGGGRAKLHSRNYPLPGDKFAAYELNLFDFAKREHSKCKVDRVDFGRPSPRWKQDGSRFTYEKVDRGHQRFRLIEVEPQTGSTRNIIDETSDTFIWTAHTENLGVRRVTWLDKTDEIVYVSERDGWRHLYLVDANAGQIKNQITNGEFVVRQVEQIDEEKRQIWFRASGRNADQDPYLIHFYRVNFDGSGLVALTEGNGNHSIQYSPDRKYVIDTYSRVDTPPVHELRRVADGKLVCELESADISELTAGGWEASEVFSAVGRDGKTEIWGIICRPRNFDPSKKYPVIEAIYAGPHNSYVPKSFSTARRYASLTDLGFVVAKLDGMGTANRSKAFHDVCWKNLKDAGFPDRILWHKAVAKKYPWYDISRVGIYGGSAGGQNSTGALLFHGDFYKVAVSSCGCHDNRMDKASWNEQWMGYPVGPHYAESSNIENAHRLRGKLLLIVGEMDTNVPPESTMRFVDALIKADKDFDLIVVPGAGHGSGGSYGRRRMYDFFVEHLSN
jgi:dipeptidyl-peptidase-4